VEEVPKLPKEQPVFLSEKHFTYLGKKFSGDTPYNPTWMAAYVQDPATLSSRSCRRAWTSVKSTIASVKAMLTGKPLERLLQSESEGGAEETELPPPDNPAWVKVRIYNEFVLANQAMTAPRPCSP
jgi:hypothetical protein